MRAPFRHPFAVLAGPAAVGLLLACDPPPLVDAGDPNLLDHVVVNEVMSRNQRAITDPFGEYDDWVELFNPTSSTVDLSGFGLSDDADDAYRYTFAPGTELAAGAYTVVWLDNDPEQGPEHASFNLGGNGEALVLTTAEGERIDLVAVPGLGADQTYGRAPDGTANLGLLESPTFGAPNSDAGAIPGAGTTASGVVINELMASNAFTVYDELGEFDDWVELMNVSEAAQSLAGHYLSDTAGIPRKWRLPDDAEIPAGGFLLVWLDDDEEQGAYHANFKLSADGESVVLAAPDGEVLDVVTFGPLAEDQSYGRLPDGTGNPAPLATPSPGETNQPTR